MKHRPPIQDPSASKSKTSSSGLELRLAVVALSALYLLSGLMSRQPHTFFDQRGFGQLPVLNGGRTKPLDTLARSSLLMLSGKQTLRTEQKTLSALDWLMDMLFQPEQAARYDVFEIDDPDVLGVLGIQQTQRRRFPFADLEPNLAELERQSTLASQVKPDQRSRFQTAIINLQDRITLYQRLQNTIQVAGSENATQALHDFETHLAPALRAHLSDPHKAAKLIGPMMRDLERYRFLDHVAEFNPLPGPSSAGRARSWMSIGSGVLSRFQSDAYHPGVWAYASMADAWRLEDSVVFNDALLQYRTWLERTVPHETRMAKFEFLFNRFEPFYKSMILYLIVFLLVLVSWMIWPTSLQTTAYALLIVTFVVHTFGLVSRMVLQGRPPVTNLYSSAVFVGWAAVLLGIILERLFRKGIGCLVASVIGFATLIIAHHLMASGDTLEMMRAVLDSNFWLATHVVCITIGYSSTFLSGFLAIVYIFRQWLDRGWTDELGKLFERMVYGIVCFSTLFSFVGTILGGIWADQSWGRFWGWDPKENGALLIVLWNVFILHARWGGFANGKNLMRLAVVGNMITALSWFGVNMLGIGLHSYGFMDKAFVWLMIFLSIQLAIIATSYGPFHRIKRN